MPNSLVRYNRRVLAVLVTAVLVIQSFLPTSFLGVSPARAADTHTWHFTDPLDYAIDGGAGNFATVMDTYAILDLTFAASEDNLGSAGPTTDVIESTTAGRILAAVGTAGTAPYSTNYGNTWGSPVSIPESETTTTHVKLTRVAAGANSGRIVAGGSKPGTGAVTNYTTDEGASWGASILVSVLTTQARAIKYMKPGVMLAGTGPGGLARDGFIFRDTNDGDGPWAPASMGGVDAGSINAFAISGSNYLAAATLDTPVDNKVAVLYSTDEGLNWVQSGITGSATTNSTVLALDVASDGTVYATTDGAYILKSTDNGVTFDKITADDAAGAKIVYVTADSEVIVINGIAVPPVVIRSPDGGTDFKTQNTAVINSITSADAIIRMSDDSFLMAVTNQNGTDGDAYNGEFPHPGITADISITNNTGQEFSEITGFSDSYASTSEGTYIVYQISNNGSSWYYWDGNHWVSAADSSDSNIATDINDHISSFDTDVGTGTFYFKAFLTGATTLTYPPDVVDNTVALNSVSITYTTGTITVTSPAANTVWHVGSTQQITWSYGGFSPSSVDLFYSTDSGTNWATIYDDWSGGTSYVWGPIPPDAKSETAKIKVATNGGTSGQSGIFYIRDNVGGPGEDVIAPYSWVDPLPYYTLTPQFDVKVTAYDELGGSGLKTVRLYYSNWIEGYDGGGWPSKYFLKLWGSWDITDPNAPPLEDGKVVFTFDTTAPGTWRDGPYAFYSVAVDFSGNSNGANKGIELPPDRGGRFSERRPDPYVEAHTIVDTVEPYLVSSDPPHGATEIPINLSKITLVFSKEMNTGTFSHTLLDATGHQVQTKVSRWKQQNTTVIISIQEELLYNTVYTLSFIAHDKAGHELSDFISFKTRPEIHPDITVSTITVPDGQNEDGTYNPGDTATYTVTLRNASVRDPANTMSAELTFAQGITYKSGSLNLQDPYNPGNSTVTLIQENGVTTGFIWSGALPVDAIEGGKNPPIVITYQAKVNNPADVMYIEQNIKLYDEIHFRHSDNTPFIPSPAIVRVAEHPDFSPSTKSADYEEVVAGDPITYTIKVTNASTAQTASSVKVTDIIPAYTTYIEGSLAGDGNWSTLEYAGGTITATAANLQAGSTYIFWFAVLTDTSSGGATITNTASITNLSGSLVPVNRSASTIVQSTPPPYLPPQIISQSPLHDSQNAPLKSPIKVGFSKNMNIGSFTFTIKLGENTLDTTKWTVSWENNNRLVTLTPPSNPETGTLYELGASYTVGVAGQDENGNPLASGALPNPWSFTTADPVVQLIAPLELLVNIPVNTVSPTFTIELQDAISGQPYKVEDNSVNIALDSNSPTGRFGLSASGFSGSIDHITIAQGKSRADFYYIDSTVSSPNYITITVFENPSQGWADSEKYAVITGEEKPTNDTLTMQTGSTITYIGQLSEPIFIRAIAGGKAADLPDMLYFNTQSAQGTFYDANFNPLPEWVTAQGSGSTQRLQYTSIPFGQRVATFYYLDLMVGSPVATVADNAPLTPDTGFTNASAVMNVLQLIEEKKLEKDLEEVKDDTGRIVDKVVIDPTEAVLLPGGNQTFKAIGYDMEGKEIKELIFRWFVISGDGTIGKKGIDGDSHRSTFKAGSQLGVFYDNVLVATLYNGKLGYATATVVVTDVVDHGGPGRLPTTGVSGLQIIFMGLTLMAAVALAWVTSYEKTHFSEEKK